MFIVRNTKDIKIHDGIVEIKTKREMVTIPISTINHIVLKHGHKLEKNQVGLIELYTQNHTSIYVIKIEDGKMAELVYHTLSSSIKDGLALERAD